MELTVNLDDELVTSLMRDGSPPEGYHIEEELRNNDTLLRLGLSEITGMFTQDEIYLIADICNGYWYRVVNPIHQLLINVSDGIQLEALDKKWGVDKKALLGKLADLSQFQAHVILTTVIQCWHRMNYSDNTLDVLLRQAFQGESLLS